ncbi:transglutaminase family protein [Prosthecomicrobium hirschii]|uniref:Transglutaminase n=1 Tax=Prosthecodimorpha hirschii TaxID=665126 RepID=A0A0P6VZ69_9HYPH|nr:transglutaminase family protein [Prosthecomicrobium hirschii]KPL50994.1 transglutaminase [Prosthecomicrobium hirschii]MCW1839188.1 transglutaminase family protein [Prosthecomicrobium hirschii]TPQ51612.1 transglutaminase family protein [Prosthecomicrobium hirschii]
MRLRITHETVYTYEKPASYAIQTLRLMPRGSQQQFVTEWRIDVSQDCRLSPVEDHFGNLTHAFSIDGPIEELSIVASGEVVTEETTGVLRGTPERLPLSLFLRSTDLTRPDPAIRAFAAAIAEGEEDRLAVLHKLMAEVHDAMRYDEDATEPSTTAADAFQAGHGVCQDLAHVFIAAARSLEIPARYVGGYMLRDDGENVQAAGHAWVEAFVSPALGWVGFDPANDICPTEAYVRVASGLDYLDAAPIRGTRYGGQGEVMKVKVKIEKTGEF